MPVLVASGLWPAEGDDEVGLCGFPKKIQGEAPVGCKKTSKVMQGLVNVLIEHHPNIGDIISNRYLKVMLQKNKMGHLPNPAMVVKWDLMVT